jgi:excisionase family DNA binding protein
VSSHDQPDARQPLLYTAEQAAELLQVSPSWLRKKAAARAVPCTFLGKHLRFSAADIAAIITAGRQPPPPAGLTGPPPAARSRWLDPDPPMERP